jgi:hypothetical protein
MLLLWFVCLSEMNQILIQSSRGQSARPKVLWNLEQRDPKSLAEESSRSGFALVVVALEFGTLETLRSTVPIQLWKKEFMYRGQGQRPEANRPKENERNNFHFEMHFGRLVKNSLPGGWLDDVPPDLVKLLLSCWRSLTACG